MKRLLSICIGCHCCIVVHKTLAQDLEQIGKKNPLEVSGGVSLNQVFYSAFGGQARRDPYSVVASGNVNFALYGWSIPLSFTFSNQGNSFPQPFNQYSVHPTYKSISAHVGYISSSYSPYTVNGHNFLGGALDYEPEGKFSVSALYGRFLRAAKFDSTAGPDMLPVFERWGYGVKALYVGERNSIQLVLFHAEDNERSLGYFPDSLNLHPQENLVVSIGGSTILLKKFQLKAELASSAVSANTNAGVESRGDIFGRLSPLFTARSSTAGFNAYKGNFDYQHASFTVGLGYEHVDPGYNTFGAYYFNSDLENITVNASTSILDGKMAIATSVGKQRDNLDGSKMSTLERTVGSANIGYSASERLSLSLAYSTFQSFTNIRSQFQQINQLTPYENIDTLNFTQLSRSANASASYAFGKNSDRKQHINLNMSAQGASERQGDVPENSGTWFYNLNCSYALSLQPSGAVVSLSLNASMNEGENSSMTYGPVASVSRSFMEKKLKLNFSLNYNHTTGLSVSTIEVLNSRIGGTLRVKKQHAVNASLAWVTRAAGKGPGRDSQFTALLGYSYNFSTRKKSEE